MTTDRGARRRRALLDQLLIGGAQTAPELSKALGWSVALVRLHARTLLRQGRIYRSDRPLVLYSVTPFLRPRTFAEIYDSLASF